MWLLHLQMDELRLLCVCVWGSYLDHSTHHMAFLLSWIEKPLCSVGPHPHLLFLHISLYIYFYVAAGVWVDFFRHLVPCAVWDGDTGIEDIYCCLLLFLQERTRSFDSFSMHSLENSLIDIMRAEQDSLKGLFPHEPLQGWYHVLHFDLKETWILLGRKYYVATVVF